ncbi:MAG: hypothetical protein M1308_16305, partial [Actinobacteria bacterium]|nr:hypothetical protein [Actinomycetota bacterium]
PGEASGIYVGLKNKAVDLISINGAVVQGLLLMTFSYSSKHFRKKTIEKVAQEFKNNLIILINHCMQPLSRGYTPSDFPLANLNSETIDRLTCDQYGINTV